MTTTAAPRPLLKLPLLMLLLGLLGLSACAPVPTLKPAASLLPPEQVGLQRAQGEYPPFAAAAGKSWWTRFNDPQLDALIDRALAQSPGLAQVRARVERASALVENARASDKPLVGAGVDATYQRYPEHSLYPPPIAGSLRTMATLQAGISYDWDFFGRHEAELKAALGQARAAEAEGEAAQLMLAAQLTRSYLSLARVLAQQELLAQQLSQREQSLALVRQRVAAGLDSSLEQRTAEAPLPELRRQAWVLDEQAALLRQQLASLSAQSAEQLAGLRPQLPQVLPLQTPSNEATALGLDLLGRRPDVVAARWRVEASTQHLALARSQFYPNLNLTAFAGFGSIGLDQLLKAGSLQYGFGPSLRLPLFDTGRLRAQLKGSAADLDASVAAYNGTLLEAVREASGQLSSLQSLQRQQQEQEALLGNARASRDLAAQRFGAGLGSKLAWLNAQGGVLQQERQSLELRGQALEAQVGLIRALGGGWQEATAAR
ncbi:NodT family efflux transporter outer membrane factor (OMF) lipoprotein [Paucibacter oligotrophus]|uniref:NodT family efflux transporter outer membrane factor (OMF) lipoprotein n=1 Tax=Roseateles oligotrophus TaxID=1769250 RepID=A0A840L7Z1_9BURK|nr:efflux transporter outer membrane subunit [Roseateles oligotrophus]MBB4844310.1 NodT family efflux transporter outer membrane factor (OMF) lipoprotein [Roseateles oligotrophus]